MYLENYDKEVYIHFGDAVEGSKKAFKWLMENKVPEWAAFSNAIRGDDDAIQWLLRRGFPELGILANGMNDEKKAMEWLRGQKDHFLYHFCQASKKDQYSIQWLKYNNLMTFVVLAEKIRKAMLVRIKDETFWYRIKW